MVCSNLQGGLCGAYVVICKVDCVVCSNLQGGLIVWCVVICKVDCVVCSNLQEKSSKRSKVQFFHQ